MPPQPQGFCGTAKVRVSVLQLTVEGAAEKAAGKVQNIVGSAKDAVRKTGKK